MKLVQSLIVSAALAIPGVSSFAQSNQTVTPANIQAGQTSVSLENGSAADSGGVADGTSAAGNRQLHSFRGAVSRLCHKIQGSVRPDANDGMKPVFFGS